MANTAIPNQPLIQHPLPYGIGRLLGASSTLVSGALPSTDSLLVPPPPVSPSGVVARSSDFEATVVNNSGVGVEAGAGNFSLVYKAENGLEAVFGDDAGALADAGTLSLGVPTPFLLVPTDEGIFLRLGALQEAGPVPFTGALDAYMSYFDYRDYTRVAVDLTDAYQDLFQGVQGKSRMLGRGGQDFGQVFAVIANFDSVDHTIEVRITDGVNTVQLPSFAATPVVAGTLVQASAYGVSHLEEGWVLQARMTVAEAARPCRFITAYTDTNLAPVRTDQGGAF